uniref:P-selectin glycoprotein ligand 1 n=1 Tax=Xiphophorus couchianus TaxID=32473 RepID=A0A3B5L7B4_9TELE
MPSSMKIRAVLLWGVCVLFPVESVTSSAPENSGTNVTVPPDITANQRITAYANTLQPATLHPAKPTDAAAHATEAASPTAPAGAFIPHIIGSTTRSTPSTTKAPCEPSKDSSSSEVLPCSTKGVVKQCLIVVAVLALVAIIFVISTIVLCIKLSARKYKVRKPQQDTEMMCISSLLPDRSHTYTRQRNPVSNGVLVYPVGGDSDEEGGDNLTLSSFLPENDRYV